MRGLVPMSEGLVDPAVMLLIRNDSSEPFVVLVSELRLDHLSLFSS